MSGPVDRVAPPCLMMETEDSILDIVDEVLTEDSDSQDEQNEKEIEVGSVKEGKKKTRRSRKNKGKRTASPFSIDRYVVDVCARLSEKRMFMVYNAIYFLGKSAFEDYLKQVDAIKAAGGVRIGGGDGSRFKTGGGLLWMLLKKNDNATYRKIMEVQNKLKEQCEEQKPLSEG